MKRPTAASLKKVTPENLASLGAERLAQILAAAALTRPELKRALRMELAAEQGADHLLSEIDKRLGSLETSRSKVSWRRRPTFVRDFDGLRVLIAQRLAGLDPAAALDRLWRFMDLARPLAGRLRDRDGELAAVFARAAGDTGRLLEMQGDARGAEALVQAVVRNPAGWTGWLPLALERSPPGLARIALEAMSRPRGRRGGLDADAPPAGRRRGRRRRLSRHLPGPGPAPARGRGRSGAAPPGRGADGRGGGAPAGDRLRDLRLRVGDRLDRLSGSLRPGRGGPAARWASFERTLSAERLRAFTRRLATSTTSRPNSAPSSSCSATAT
jgi:hypothetical protein